MKTILRISIAALLTLSVLKTAHAVMTKSLLIEGPSQLICGSADGLYHLEASLDTSGEVARLLTFDLQGPQNLPTVPVTKERFEFFFDATLIQIHGKLPQNQNAELNLLPSVSDSLIWTGTLKIGAKEIPLTCDLK